MRSGAACRWNHIRRMGRKQSRCRSSSRDTTRRDSLFGYSRRAASSAWVSRPLASLQGGRWGGACHRTGPPARIPSAQPRPCPLGGRHLLAHKQKNVTKHARQTETKQCQGGSLTSGGPCYAEAPTRIPAHVPPPSISGKPICPPSQHKHCQEGHRGARADLGSDTRPERSREAVVTVTGGEKSATTAARE